MGWFWSSGASNVDQQSAPANTTIPTSSIPSSSQATRPPSPPQSPSQLQSRDQKADDEFASLWKELEGSTTAASQSSKKYQRTSKFQSPPPTSTSTSPSQSQGSASNPEMAFSEQMLPTEMSCRQTFDNAFYCQSLGGQFNNLYRYGEIRQCSELWWDFWFCMKARSFSGVAKEELIREHNRRKAQKYVVGPSSEDVWTSRDRKMDWGEAFSHKFEEAPAGESDEEWNRRERERRAGRLGTLGS